MDISWAQRAAAWHNMDTSCIRMPIQNLHQREYSRAVYEAMAQTEVGLGRLEELLADAGYAVTAARGLVQDRMCTPITIHA